MASRLPATARLRLWRLLPVLGVGLVLASGCRKREHFPEIGDNVASPVDVALSADQKYFFVLNADFDRTYNKGSVLVLDTEGNKVGAVPVPRMGRSIATAGKALVVTTDQQNDDNNYNTPPQAFLFDVSNPANPVQVTHWNLNCAPFNTVLSEGTGGAPNYIAIACDGNVYLGTWGADLSQTSLKEVRAFGQTRRALYFDRKRELLMAFATDTSKGLLADQELPDVFSYDKNGISLSAGNPLPNEVPDGMESNSRVQADTLQQETYQFMVYDLKAERDAATAVKNGCVVTPTETCVYPFRDANDLYARNELRWIYFNLANYDGTPDRSPSLGFANYNFYRTNFYDAQPDPDNPDVFYLSQRGSPDRSPFANNIVKVTIIGDLHPVAKMANGRSALPTSQVMTFERVYGFKGPEATRHDYPGSFRIAKVAGKKIVVVNNFRDLINWVRDDTYYSIAAQTLDDNVSWFNEIVGGLDRYNVTSYYQLAITPAGRALSLSFYGNAVILLDVAPGVDINEVKRIQ